MNTGCPIARIPSVQGANVQIPAFLKSPSTSGPRAAASLHYPAAWKASQPLRYLRVGRWATHHPQAEAPVVQ